MNFQQLQLSNKGLIQPQELNPPSVVIENPPLYLIPLTLYRDHIITKAIAIKTTPCAPNSIHTK